MASYKIDALRARFADTSMPWTRPHVESLIDQIEELTKQRDEGWTALPIEPFVVKHYAADERPSIKGNGFDGLEIGTERQDVQDFVDWINARLALKRADEPEGKFPGAARSAEEMKIYQAGYDHGFRDGSAAENRGAERG